ncbi:double-strand break repair helicase AddA [Sphingomonas morindae]|uniref:DNA 3'-5' helicase n=1 Tax=Sphingomonas morindae TaxID=1541170 RepID=A0ABY4X6V3_9SPHN|nr:double-strand break repair helicase AddA [Sphingomonas morindae]USI72659.1 double-strand break repair helicase AddA [Sphingomonas morindae]
MSGRIPLLKPLQGAQALAADPARLVWLSASAGTGKTHVLTARVIRLLLAGNDPASILCLTFTKAGAAEMADRIHARLASWVRMRDQDLRKELFALGEANHPAAIAHARTLFARVLEATGGGLRIQTIHAFCQALLGAFPGEAGLVPGFRLIEAREEAALARATLADLLVAAETGGDRPLIADIELLSRRLGEERAEAFLRACGRVPEAMAGLGAAPGIEARLRRLLDVPAGPIETILAERCATLDAAALARLHAANQGWNTARGRERAAAIAAWLALDADARAAGLATLHAVWATAKGELRACGKGQAPQEPGYAEDAAALHGACGALLALRAKAAFAALLAAALRAGQAYARAWTAAKRAAGAVDFDDLIRTTVALLDTPGMGEWVRFKLDQRTDHILVDEAQDTNARQWAIVARLVEDFWTEDPDQEPPPPLRTLFTVGDFKQAIFGFQGTDPLFFEAAQRLFAERAGAGGRRFEPLSLDRSFRSFPPVLALVDALIDRLGGPALGLAGGVPKHEAARRGPGAVFLWPPLTAEDEEEGEAEAPEGEEGWLDTATRRFADRLAQQIRAWIDAAPWLASRGRPLRPEDVMVLVRKRGDLAALIVARLHAHGVPVAGVDRLRLDAPLAVRDLLAAARFALQPEDDLTLAHLLVSPLFGLDQETLFALAHRRPGTLLAAVRADPAQSAVADALGAILAAADLVTPYRFFEELLSGPFDGRRRMLERLGEDARDPIEELLNAALGFEEEGQPSLQPFLDWFDRGEVQIKRDPSAPLDAVRVMTAHGAKGLQAPVVVLADATGDPARAPVGGFDLPIDETLTVPSLRPRAEERVPPFDQLLAKAEARDRREHWRLLYVAATRAEEWLAIGGALGPLAKGVPPQESWYAALAAALDTLGGTIEPDPLWGEVRVHRDGSATPGRPRRVVAPPAAAEPGWLRARAPAEQRPPRPLAPSAIGRDDVPLPPPGPAQRAAAARGRLLHSLFERLPACPPEARHAAAVRWLTEAAGVARDEAGTLAVEACAILADPRFAPLFHPDALAEAPIAAVVEGAVIAGTVDRLLVSDTDILFLDFKTGRRVPAGVETVPPQHLAQMSAYAAALASIFPDRPVRGALLYTEGPALIALPPDLLARHKPGLAAAEQSFGLPR